MLNTSLPSAINDEINAIECEFDNCFESGSPIDTKKLKRLAELRSMRVSELVSAHVDRSEIMRIKTREWMAKMPVISEEAMKLNPPAAEKLHSEMDKYDAAAVHWVISEQCAWDESEAYRISIGCLIRANEIC